MKIHPSAHVDPSAELGQDVEVGPAACIGPEVRVGPDCSIGHGCTLTGCTELGSNNILYPHVVLGTPPQDLKYHGGQTKLVIGDDNVFREFVTINTGTTTGGGVTRLGDRNYLMITSHIGHDCEVHDDVLLVNSVLIGGHCSLEGGAKLMGSTAVAPFVSVGKLAFVGVLTRVVHDVPPFLIVSGNPAKARGVNEIGLQRAGYEKDVISNLWDTYKAIYRTEELNRSRVVEEIEMSNACTEESLYLVRFLRRSLQGRYGRYRESLRDD